MCYDWHSACSKNKGALSEKIHSLRTRPTAGLLYRFAWDPFDRNDASTA